MYRTDDPLKDFERYCEEMNKLELEFPVCDYCGNKIFGYYYYEINDCILCEDCLNENFRKDIDDYVLKEDSEYLE